MKNMIMMAALVACLANASAGEKLVIGHSWDLLDATPEDLLANADEFDKTGLDGVTIKLPVRARADGTKMDFLRMRGDKAWTAEPYYSYDATIRELVKHPSMRHAMPIVFWGTGKRIAWDDDALWGEFCKSMAAMASLAKRWNLPGLVIDPEDYNSKHQFQREKETGDWETLRKLARRRGREMAEAIFGAYPACRLLPFWTFSYCEPIFFQDPDRIAKAYYDLRFDFFNGLMDGLKPESLIYDGNENAYTARADMNDFFFQAWRMKDGIRSLVAKENWEKFDRQWPVSFGLYPDAHIRKKGSGWCFHRGEWDLAPNILFSMNIEQSLKAASDLVWVYGEKRGWIKWKGKKFAKYNEWGTWEETLPGFATALRYAKDPMRAFGEDLKAGRLAACADETQLKDEKGEGGLYKVLVVRNVKAGEPFAISFKTHGKRPRAWIFWHVDGKLRRGIWPVDIGVAEKPGADGRWEGAAVVRVPVPTIERRPTNVDGLEVRLYADYEATELPRDIDLKVYPILKAVPPKD